MENIIWIIYFADIVEKISGVIIFIGIVFTAIAIISSFVFTIMNEKLILKHLFFLIPAFFFLLIGNLLPSKQTIYLMLGTQLTIETVQTEEAKDIMNDIRLIIKNYAKSSKE